MLPCRKKVKLLKKLLHLFLITKCDSNIFIVPYKRKEACTCFTYLATSNARWYLHNITILINTKLYHKENVTHNYYQKANNVDHQLCITEYLKKFKMTGILTSLLKKVASKIREKLCSYALKQLPGGCYLDPDQKTKHILCELKPSKMYVSQYID